MALIKDARQFNVTDVAGRLLCPACGYPDYSDDEAYDQRGGLIGITICACCLWEPGFDDDALASRGASDTILASLRRYRARWGGAPQWAGMAPRRPDNWDGAAQLAKLFEVAPYLR